VCIEDFPLQNCMERMRSEGQETGAIVPAPENARKKFEGRGRLRP
jgi:hypothetical protein